MKLLRPINRQPILLIISQLLQQNKHTFSLQVNVHFCSTSWAESVQTNRRTRPLSSWVRQWIQIGGADISDGLAAVPKSETQTPSVNNYYHDIDCCNHVNMWNTNIYPDQMTSQRSLVETPLSETQTSSLTKSRHGKSCIRAGTWHTIIYCIFANPIRTLFAVLEG